MEYIDTRAEYLHADYMRLKKVIKALSSVAHEDERVASLLEEVRVNINDVKKALKKEYALKPHKKIEDGVWGLGDDYGIPHHKLEGKTIKFVTDEGSCFTGVITRIDFNDNEIWVENHKNETHLLVVNRNRVYSYHRDNVLTGARLRINIINMI